MSSKWNNFINSFADRSSFSKLNELSTGVLYGGTITSDYTINKVDIEAGVGQLLIKEDNCEYLRQFSWGTIINYEITDVGSYEYTVIYVDRFGTIRQRKTMLTDEELETNIVLGIVFHIDNIKVNQIINQKTVPLDTPGRVITFLRKLGLMRVDGLSIEPNTGLKVDRSEGTIFGLGVNYYSGSTNVDELYLSGQTFCNIVYVYKDGLGGFTYDNNGGSFYIVVDPNFYDDGSGTLSIVGGTRWSIQRCYLFPENPSELVIYYGQNRYTSYDEARASLEYEVFEEDEISKRNAVFLGYIIIKNGTTDLSDLNDCKILQSGFIRNLPIGGGGSGGSSIDTFVTGFTYDPLNNEFTISRNQGNPDLTAIINSVNGLSINGDLDVTGVTTVNVLNISGTTDCNNNDILNVNNLQVTTINSNTPGTVTSVDLSMPSAFSVANNPVIGADTLTVTVTGTTSQLIDGTGALQSIPTSLPPTGIAGGDLTGTYPNPTVDGLQGNAVANIVPVNGQVLQWNGSAWIPGAVPTGGSGGGGIVYYLNYQNTTDISPTTGLPTSPVAPSQLGIAYSIGLGSITSANLTQGSYDLVCGFVTIVGTPGVTNIPAGLWDFNIWVDIIGTAPQANQTQFQIRVYKYNSSTGIYTSLANSDDIYVYDPVTIAQYIGNVTMPQTTLLVTDRIYIELWAQKNVSNSRVIRFYFDSLHPSHVHTTIPSVAGTGIVKVVNGVFQSPASTIVDTDISATAAITQSKLALIDAAADGTTKGIATFTASDFDSSAGLISIDYTNGQSASGSNKGFLTSSDWTTFNGKVSGTRNLTINGTTQDLSADRTWSVGTVTSVGLSMPAAFTVSNSPVTSSGSINVTGAGLSSQYIRGDGSLATNSGSFGLTIDGGGSVITTGNKGYLVVPYAGTITGWQVISDVNGSCVIDVWKASANNIPTLANTITGTEKPTLSSQQINSDLTLTTWTTTVNQNDVFAFNVDSASTVTRVNLTIFITKS